MKKSLLLILILVAISVVAYQFKPVKHIANAIIVSTDYINEEGTTINNRVKIPNEDRCKGFDIFSRFRIFCLWN